MTATVYENESFGLSNDEYEILLEDIDQAIAEGNRKYGYGNGYGYDYGYGENIKSKSKPKSKPRSKLRPQIYYNRVRRIQNSSQQMMEGLR